MADETDTLSEMDGTDNVEPSQDDTASEWDYYDPDDDQDTVETPDDEATEDEAGEPDDNPEEEPEEEPDQTDDEPTMADENAVVRLADGTETTVAELSKGYLRQADFTRKTQEVAETRNRVLAQAERAQRITDALVDQLSNFIPDQPDPRLAYSDPARFTAQKAQHEAAIAKMQEIISVADSAKGVQSDMSNEDRQRMIAEETTKLVNLFPETATENGRRTFFDGASKAAMDLGFSEREVQSQMDHRMFALAHYAKIGMAAEKAKASAKAKVAQVAPTPRQKPGQGARPKNSNREASERFRRNPTIENAVKLDF